MGIGGAETGSARSTPARPLSDEDLSILALENETVAGHTCKVIILGAPIDVETLRTSIAARIDRAPILRMRLVVIQGRPWWIAEDDVDLDHHVQVYAGSAPLDDSGLRQTVARLFEQRLDRDRPLWRIDVIPSLAQGGSALVWRIHHALADGDTVMRTAAAALWDEEPTPPEAENDPRPPVHPRPASHEAGHEPSHARLVHLRTVVHEAPHLWLRSPFSGHIGARREVAFTHFDLERLHTVAHATGATINDAVLTIVAGGLRRWLERDHGRLGHVRVKVPVSLHGAPVAGQASSEPGNRDSFFCLDLPLGSADPVARLSAVRDATRIRKNNHDAEHLDELMRRLADAPRLRRFVADVLSHPRAFALNVSNVRGPAHPVSVLGSRVKGMYPIAEIRDRHALRIAVASLARTLYLGFAADPTLVARVASLAEDIREEGLALLAEAGVGA